MVSAVRSLFVLAAVFEFISAFLEFCFEMSTGSSLLPMQDAERVTMRSVAGNAFEAPLSPPPSPSCCVLCASCGGFLPRETRFAHGFSSAKRSPGVDYFFEAQGTLQYRVATVFKAPVRVEMLQLVPRGGEGRPAPWIFDRHVKLFCDAFDDAFCDATSVVTIQSCGERILGDFGRVGLGQLFKKYAMGLEFRLISTTASSRSYILTCEKWGISCRITERFTKEFLRRVDERRCSCNEQ